MGHSKTSSSTPAKGNSGNSSTAGGFKKKFPVDSIDKGLTFSVDIGELGSIIKWLVEAQKYSLTTLEKYRSVFEPVDFALLSADLIKKSRSEFTVLKDKVILCENSAIEFDKSLRETNKKLTEVDSRYQQEIHKIHDNVTKSHREQTERIEATTRQIAHVHDGITEKIGEISEAFAKQTEEMRTSMRKQGENLQEEIDHVSSKIQDVDVRVHMTDDNMEDLSGRVADLESSQLAANQSAQIMMQNMSALANETRAANALTNQNLENVFRGQSQDHSNGHSRQVSDHEAVKHTKESESIVESEGVSSEPREIVESAGRENPKSEGRYVGRVGGSSATSSVYAPAGGVPQSSIPANSIAATIESNAALMVSLRPGIDRLVNDKMTKALQRMCSKLDFEVIKQKMRKVEALQEELKKSVSEVADGQTKLELSRPVESVETEEREPKESSGEVRKRDSKLSNGSDRKEIVIVKEVVQKDESSQTTTRSVEEERVSRVEESIHHIKADLETIRSDFGLKLSREEFGHQMRDVNRRLEKLNQIVPMVEDADGRLTELESSDRDTSRKLTALTEDLSNMAESQHIQNREIGIVKGQFDSVREVLDEHNTEITAAHKESKHLRRILAAEEDMKGEDKHSAGGGAHGGAQKFRSLFLSLENRLKVIEKGLKEGRTVSGIFAEEGDLSQAASLDVLPDLTDNNQSSSPVADFYAIKRLVTTHDGDLKQVRQQISDTETMLMNKLKSNDDREVFKQSIAQLKSEMIDMIRKVESKVALKAEQMIVDEIRGDLETKISAELTTKIDKKELRKASQTLKRRIDDLNSKVQTSMNAQVAISSSRDREGGPAFSITKCGSCGQDVVDPSRLVTTMEDQPTNHHTEREKGSTSTSFNHSQGVIHASSHKNADGFQDLQMKKIMERAHQLGVPYSKILPKLSMDKMKSPKISTAVPGGLKTEKHSQAQTKTSFDFREVQTTTNARSHRVRTNQSASLSSRSQRLLDPMSSERREGSNPADTAIIVSKSSSQLSLAIPDGTGAHEVKE